jgi:hypothetical protein
MPQLDQLSRRSERTPVVPVGEKGWCVRLAIVIVLNP